MVQIIAIFAHSIASVTVSRGVAMFAATAVGLKGASDTVVIPVALLIEIATSRSRRRSATCNTELRTFAVFNGMFASPLTAQFVSAIHSPIETSSAFFNATTSKSRASRSAQEVRTWNYISRVEGGRKIAGESHFLDTGPKS